VNSGGAVSSYREAAGHVARICKKRDSCLEDPM
jgi:hypothetical protein